MNCGEWVDTEDLFLIINLSSMSLLEIVEHVHTFKKIYALNVDSLCTLRSGGLWSFKLWGKKLAWIYSKNECIQVIGFCILRTDIVWYLQSLGIILENKVVHQHSKLVTKLSSQYIHYIFKIKLSKKLCDPLENSAHVPLFLMNNARKATNKHCHASKLLNLSIEWGQKSTEQMQFECRNNWKNLVTLLFYQIEP